MLNDGKISFYTEANVPVGEARITDGKYDTFLLLGDKTEATFSVKLNKRQEPKLDPKKVRAKIPQKFEEKDYEAFPAKYNKNTTLSITVKDGQKNKGDFACKSDEPPKKK